MGPISIEYGGDAFWEGIAVRVGPYLGDVADTFGPSWRDRFEGCFTKADFAVFQAAGHFAGKVPRWHVAQLDDRSRGSGFQALRAGASHAHCVALMQDQFQNAGAAPGLFYDEQNNRTMFLLEGAVLAVIAPVTDERRIDGALRSRVESTLTGLRTSDCIQAQFAKRLSHWPKLHVVRRHEATGAMRELHFPCAYEWLRSAKRLLLEAGREVSSATTQALTAAIFGMKTWNHLCANLPKAEKSDWWALYSPFVVRSEGPGLATGIQLFAHPVAAFLEFHARAVDSMKTGQQLESEILSDDAGFPVLRVRSADRDESSDRPPASTITLEPVIQPRIDPVRVGSAHPNRPTHAMNGVRR